MLLKSLELRGFKSFADPVTLEFEPGITVVVGPNGSGKSNIVDAICWVLGTQASTTLRTSTMQDVIFSGSPQRKPLGRAKVVLTFDNSDRQLPIDLSEVSIARVLHRDGESEYFINGSPCRLLDIQELLSDTGVGKMLHSIVGQGQLDTVLSASPTERRGVIEEAAGILKYRRRKERALRRLAGTEENLQRVNDLMKEIQRQLRPLQRQVSAARRHQELAQRVETVRQELFRRRLHKAREEWDRWEAAVRESSNLASACERAARELESRLEETSIEEARASEVRAAALEAERRLLDLRERCSGSADLARERKKYFEAVARKSAAMHLDLLGADLEQVTAKMLEIEDSLPVLAERLRRAVEDESRAMAVLEAMRRQSAESERDAIEAAELAAERSSLESSVARAEIEISRLVEQKRAVDSALERSRQERERLNDEIERLDAQAGPLSQEVSRLARERDLLKDELRRLEEERRKAQSDLAMWGGRLEALRELSTRITAAEGPERILEAGLEGVIGGLWELIEVEQGLELAVEAALGEFSRAVVVLDDEVFQRCAGLLGSGDEEGMAWVLAAGGAASSDGVKSWRLGAPAHDTPPAAEARPLLEFVTVKVSAPSGPAVDELVGVLLARAYLVSSFADASRLARRYPGLSFVTRSGELVAAGAAKMGKVPQGPLAHLASLSEVAARAREAEQRCRRVDKAIEERAEQVAKVERNLEAAEHALAECDALVTQAASELARLDPEIERLAAERRSLEDAEASLIQRVAADRARLAEIDGFLSELRSGRSQSEAGADFAAAEESGDRSPGGSRERSKSSTTESGSIPDSRRRSDPLAESFPNMSESHPPSSESVQSDDAIACAEAELAAARDRRREAERELAAAEERHAVLASRRAQLEASLAEERKRLGKEESRLEKAKRLAARAARLQERASGLHAALGAAESELRELLERVETAFRSAAQAKARVESRFRASEEELRRATEEARKAELEAVRTKTVMEQLEAEARAAGFDPAELAEWSSPAAEDLSGFDEATLAAELEALERDLGRLGPINQLAIKDYEEASKRLEFVSSQAEDLQSSKKELQKVVDAVEKQMLQMFVRAFDEVATAFEEVLDLLFPGGSGRIFLEDPSAPLDSGVEVEVKPPGKVVKRMSLLSGGERSLVALAFLFAVYSARPSPFYVLDEVEAALDDTNLERFLRLLSRFRHRSQLVVVTHQKRTVEVADALYGVSMQSDGVSRVVSYKVSESLTYS